MVRQGVAHVARGVDAFNGIKRSCVKVYPYRAGYQHTPFRHRRSLFSLPPKMDRRHAVYDGTTSSNDLRNHPERNDSLNVIFDTVNRQPSAFRNAGVCPMGEHHVIIIAHDQTDAAQLMVTASLHALPCGLRQESKIFFDGLELLF